MKKALSIEILQKYLTAWSEEIKRVRITNIPEDITNENIDRLVDLETDGNGRDSDKIILSSNPFFWNGSQPT